MNTKFIYKSADFLFLLIPFLDFTLYIDCKFADIRFTYLIYIFYFLIHIKSFISSVNFFDLVKKHRFIAAAAALIAAVSLYNISAGNNTLFLFLKQGLIISATAFISFMFVFNNKNNLEYIVNLYIKICFIFAAVGVFQEYSHFVNFKYGYFYDYIHLNNQLSFSGNMLRVTSLTNEPSFLIYAMMPAFYIALTSFLTKARQSLIVQLRNITIILCVFLTYSSLGYTGIFLSFASILFWNIRQIKFSRMLLFIITGLFLFCLGKNAVSERFFYTYKQLTHSVNLKNKETKEYVNMSSYYLALHAKRAFDDFKHKPFFGTGLGSYTYPEHALEIYKKFHYKKFFQISSEDVVNTSFRILSELGLFGITLLLIFLFYNYIFDLSFQNKTNYFIIINNACLIYILLRLLRNGSYYSDGLWIFIFMYYYSKKLFLEQNKNENA